MYLWEELQKLWFFKLNIWIYHKWKQREWNAHHHKYITYNIVGRYIYLSCWRYVLLLLLLLLLLYFINFVSLNPSFICIVNSKDFHRCSRRFSVGYIVLVVGCFVSRTVRTTWTVRSLRNFLFDDIILTE